MLGADRPCAEADPGTEKLGGGSRMGQSPPNFWCLMGLSVRNDPKRPFGGHALLEGEDLAGVTSLTFENVYSGLFLSEGGRWAKRPQAFPVAPAAENPNSLSLGPNIVDFIPGELQLAVRTGDGADLGRLFWVDIVPSRSRTVTIAPPEAPFAQPSPAEPRLVDKPPALPEAELPPPPLEPEPSKRTPGWRPHVALLGLAAFALAGAVAYAMIPRTRPPVAPLEARDCATAFSGRLAALATTLDGDRVKLAEDALAGGCGVQAFAALDGIDWEASEPAAWYLARFYDPDESAPAFRSASAVHPDWAAAYYVRWASRSPRQAAALKQLCRTNAELLNANTQLKRACAH